EADVMMNLPVHQVMNFPMLPPAHIHRRAVRYMVKLFLSHAHMVGHFVETGELPVAPYVIEHLGHKDMIYPPHQETIPGLSAALHEQFGI
ncbi:hypothetical protein, partial [Staphylococcus aureus]